MSAPLKRVKGMRRLRNCQSLGMQSGAGACLDERALESAPQADDMGRPPPKSGAGPFVPRETRTLRADERFLMRAAARHDGLPR